MSRSDHALRESLLGQLDAMEIMVNGLYKQMTAIRRAVSATGSTFIYSDETEPAKPKDQASDGYTTPEEDDKISQYLDIQAERQQEALFSQAIQQLDEEANDGEPPRADTEQYQQ